MRDKFPFTLLKLITPGGVRTRKRKRALEKFNKVALPLMLVSVLTGCANLFPGDYARRHAAGTGCVIIGWGDQPNNAGNRTSGIRLKEGAAIGLVQ